jgi:hypothetical protein
VQRVKPENLKRMANSKPKTKSNSTEKKPVAASKASKTKKIAATGTTPGESEIRLKAQEIYIDRISRGEPGTPEDDWLRAERLLKE